MCGRYWADYEESNADMQALMAELNRLKIEPIRGEITPGMKAPVFIDGGAANMLWGVGLDSGTLINARSETAREKPLFRQSARSRRCAIPASGFFEWRREPGVKKGAKHSLAPVTGGVLWMAGLFLEQDERRFVVLTRQADAQVAPLHDRMPLCLPKSLLRGWLRGDDAAYEESLRVAPPSLTVRPTEPVQTSLFG